MPPFVSCHEAIWLKMTKTVSDKSRLLAQRNAPDKANILASGLFYVPARNTGKRVPLPYFVPAGAEYLCAMDLWIILFWSKVRLDRSNQKAHLA